MSDNVVPFDEFDNELQITNSQSEIPRIVLEGGDDVVLFRQWFFDKLDRFEFIQASNVGAGSGCTAVPDAVRRLLDQGVKAYGLSDRDRLFREADWPLLFSVDDAAFTAATENDETAVNLLWEIEAYVLAPEVIPNWVRAHHRYAPASQADCTAAIARAIEECESLLGAQSWLATAHRCGQGVPDGQYCNVPSAEFTGRCAEELGSLNDAHGTAAQVDHYVAAILAAAPADPPERLRWLLRYVDTKRLMLRLQHRLALGNARHKWVLAEFMSLRGLRPAELENRLGDIGARLGH